MAVITIDGIKLDVPENKNVLDCALENGIYIPHLCHHKDLSPLGAQVQSWNEAAPWDCTGNHGAAGHTDTG